jgi:hypothetical protein
MLYNRKYIKLGVPLVPRVGLFATSPRPSGCGLSAAIPHPVNLFHGNITANKQIITNG